MLLNDLSAILSLRVSFNLNLSRDTSTSSLEALLKCLSALKSFKLLVNLVISAVKSEETVPYISFYIKVGFVYKT